MLDPRPAVGIGAWVGEPLPAFGWRIPLDALRAGRMPMVGRCRERSRALKVRIRVPGNRRE